MRSKKQIVEKLETIRVLLERLDTAIITRYPDSSRAAEEYAALRKGVMTMASASTMQRHNLITLINAIDEGASPATVRGKIVDLLNTLKVTEVVPDQASTLPRSEASNVFQEVGDAANPRSAWLFLGEDGAEVLQKGHIPSLDPPITDSVTASPAEEPNHTLETQAEATPSPETSESENLDTTDAAPDSTIETDEETRP